jgi:hypothetical protein
VCQVAEDSKGPFGSSGFRTGRFQNCPISGSCPDSVAVVKKSSFFKLKKEREKREKKEVYHAIVCPKS